MDRSILRHRGLDDEGPFFTPDGDAGLVNTRLSILDLSTAGPTDRLGPRHDSYSRHSVFVGKRNPDRVWHCPWWHVLLGKGIEVTIATMDDSAG